MPVILTSFEQHGELINSSQGIGVLLTFATLIDFSILAACLLRSSIFLPSDVICANNVSGGNLAFKAEKGAQQNVPPPFDARTAQ